MTDPASAPRISLITPSYQQAAYLEECLASVRAQIGAEVEHIVVDGGSTDGSKTLIELYATDLAWYCSERDKGQSDAINKGLAHASGEVFGWLNSDDALMPGALARVSEAFAGDPGLLVFGGRIIHREGKGDHPFERINDAADARRLFRDPVINQPATFYRMSAVRAIGGVDAALRYVMDVELWLQLLFRYGTGHVRFEHTDFAIFRLHEASKTVSQHGGFLREMATLIHDLCERTDNVDLARVMAIGYPDRPLLRGIPANPAQHGAIVHGMAVHFLLKWHGHLHHEREFDMMRALSAMRIVDPADLLPGMAVRWEKVRLAVEGNTWNRYRIRRKLKHLFG